MSEPSSRILLVEDDAEFAALVAEYLRPSGFEVVIEGRGDRALEAVRRVSPDLVILDLMLPGMDGLSVCRALRPEWSGPLLMLTAQGDTVDEIVGLELGADDYLGKPVAPRLLLARVRSLLRRSLSSETQGLVEHGPLRIDLDHRRVWMSECPVTLTTAEFDALALLAVHPGEVLSRDRFYRELRGSEYDGLD